LLDLDGSERVLEIGPGYLARFEKTIGGPER
jgi:hypothetical protein